MLHHPLDTRVPLPVSSQAHSYHATSKPTTKTTLQDQTCTLISLMQQGRIAALNRDSQSRYPWTGRLGYVGLSSSCFCSPLLLAIQYLPISTYGGASRTEARLMTRQSSFRHPGIFSPTLLEQKGMWHVSHRSTFVHGCHRLP